MPWSAMPLYKTCCPEPCLCNPLLGLAKMAAGWFSLLAKLWKIALLALQFLFSHFTPFSQGPSTFGNFQ